MKKRVFIACVVPCFLYGCETWALKVEEKKKIDVAQRRMERAMLGITRLDRVRNEEIANRTRLPRVTELAWKRKVKWATKVANADVRKWSRRISEWFPRGAEYKRDAKRPVLRWEDELMRRLRDAGLPGGVWMRMARCQKKEWAALTTPARNQA